VNSLPKTDTEIIEDVRAGNVRAYTQLVERHKDRALSLALRLTGERREAEELVQDAFLKAFRNLGQFRGDARFGTWFYRILYNLCMTRLRRRMSGPDTLAVQDDDLLGALAPEESDNSLDQQIEIDDLARFLSMEVDLLPHQYKTAVTLYYIQEMSYDEIAAVMDIPLGTVKTCLFRGRNLLRKRMHARLKEEVKVA
jgi:RNA polymerase sigma-70 factor, ECF subfamily